MDLTAELRTAPSLAPGTLFGGRFRIIRWLGSSASGEVWQADDLVLQSAVALKIIRSDTADDRERILTEARLARQITHPAVRRVFDVGEFDGRAFCSMELIEGEDLRALLRRVGRLPAEKVRAIGLQLCDALAAAHAEGVLHRDVALENILIGHDGAVRMTDFGIRNQGGPFSEAADLQALGAVLYELLVGVPPSMGTRRQTKPSAVVPDVDRALERTILRLLQPAFRRRPQPATDVRAQLSGVAAPDDPSWGPAWIAGGLGVAAVLVVGAVALFPYLRPSAVAPLSDQDTILLADVLNSTGDAVFDGALEVALAVALEQSPFLRVIPEERVRETLQLMQLPPDARVTRELAPDVAQREQARAFVAASIGPLGTNYVISLEAVEAASGDVMAREQVEAAGKEDVLTALGAAVSRLRERLGESLTLVERFDVPLARATTPSLEALRAYSQALDGGRLNPRAEAIAPLRRAIELDPDFAMAHALLSGVYANTGRFADAPAHARRAFELRDRVSERERFFISWRYYLDAEQAWDKALTLARAWTATYPREAFAFNSLALSSSAVGDRQSALAALREAIRLDPKFVPSQRNLVGNLIAVNRFAEASAALDEVMAGGINVTGTRFASFVLSTLGARSAPPIPDPDWTVTWEARAAAAAGRFAEAQASYARAIAHASSRDLRDLAAQWSMESAELHALAGECAPARGRIGEGLQFGRDNFTLERANRALALCGDAGGVARLTSELANRYPDATLTHRLQIPLARAVLNLRGGDPARAIDDLDTVRPLDHAPSAEFWPIYIRAQAYLEQGNGRAALEQFEQITSRRGEAPLSPLYALAHLGQARAHEALGEGEAAQESTRQFRALWGNADRRLVVHFSASRP